MTNTELLRAIVLSNPTQYFLQKHISLDDLTEGDIVIVLTEEGEYKLGLLEILNTGLFTYKIKFIDILNSKILTFSKRFSKFDNISVFKAKISENDLSKTHMKQRSKKKKNIQVEKQICLESNKKDLIIKKEIVTEKEIIEIENVSLNDLPIEESKPIIENNNNDGFDNFLAALEEYCKDDEDAIWETIG